MNNNYGRLQELIFALKFSWACRSISSKRIETLALCPPKLHQPCPIPTDLSRLMGCNMYMPDHCPG